MLNHVGPHAADPLVDAAEKLPGRSTEWSWNSIAGLEVREDPAGPWLASKKLASAERRDVHDVEPGYVLSRGRRLPMSASDERDRVDVPSVMSGGRRRRKPRRSSLAAYPVGPFAAAGSSWAAAGVASPLVVGPTLPW